MKEHASDFDLTHGVTVTPDSEAIMSNNQSKDCYKLLMFYIHKFNSNKIENVYKHAL